MKKFLMLAAVVAAFASCQSNSKKNADAELEDSLILMEAPVVEYDEVFTGTIPAADGPGIDYILTLGVTTDGIGKHQTFHSKGKQQKIQKVVNNKPKTAVKLTPDNGDQPMYFVVVNDTTLRLVNDSTLVETIGQAVYDITKAN